MKAVVSRSLNFKTQEGSFSVIHLVRRRTGAALTGNLNTLRGAVVSALGRNNDGLKY